MTIVPPLPLSEAKAEVARILDRKVAGEVVSCQL
jgi:hypothetical protein